jgi:rubrerythrin
MLEQIVVPVLLTFFTALITWFFARAKNKRDLRSQDIENEIKSAKYYQGLLDDMSKRLDKAIEELMASEERHTNLMAVNRNLVVELQKFKQLNGKSQ